MNVVVVVAAGNAAAPMSGVGRLRAANCPGVIAVAAFAKYGYEGGFFQLGAEVGSALGRPHASISHLEIIRYVSTDNHG